MFCFFKQKTAYEMRISDWSSDVCSSDLQPHFLGAGAQRNVDLEPPLVIGSAAQRVVDQLVAVDRRVEHRISRIADIDIGVADHARADAADVEAAQVEIGRANV